MTLELLIVKNYLKTYKDCAYYYFFKITFFYMISIYFFSFKNLVSAKKHVVQVVPLDIFQQKCTKFKPPNLAIELSKQEKD